MRNLKKFLAVALAIALVVTALVPAFAADSKSDSKSTSSSSTDSKSDSKSNSDSDSKSDSKSDTKSNSDSDSKSDSKSDSDSDSKSTSTTKGSSFASDITDAKVKAAVEELHAFGIISGKDDGKYHQDDPLTKDEFTKMVVEAMKLGSAANVATGTTFSDVPATKWSSGYINVATGQGLLKGRPDGTFGPDAKVTYAEACTILVRALGYKDSFLPGAWPGNFLAKAADVDITKDVKVTADGSVDRGSAAVMVAAALDAKVVTVSTYNGTNGTEYSVSDKTLLEDKLGYDKVENARYIANQRNDADLKSNKVYFEALKDKTTIDGNDYDEGDTTAALEISDSIDKEALLGYQVKAYMDDDKILYMTADETDKVVEDYTKVADDTGDKDVTNDDDGLYLGVLDDNYKFDDKAKVFINGKQRTLKASNAYSNLAFDTDAMFGRFVIENSKIVWADLMDTTETSKIDTKDGVDTFIVTKVDTSGQILTGIMSDDASKDEEVNLKDDYDKYVILSGDRKTLSLSDIKANDVVYVVHYDIDGDDTGVVTVVQNNTLTGKLTDYAEDSVTIDGKDYDVNTTKASYTANNYDDVREYDDKTYGWDGSSSEMDDLTDSSVTAIKDVTTKIAFITADVDATSGEQYGIVTRVFRDSDKVKVYTKTSDGEGDEMTYEVETSDDLDGVHLGNAIAFKLNKDGQIADGKLNKLDITTGGHDFVSAWGTVETGKTNIAVDTSKGKGGYETSSKKYSKYTVSDDTILIDARRVLDVNGTSDTWDDPTTTTTETSNSITDDDFDLINWEDIDDEDTVGNTGDQNTAFAVFGDDEGKAKAIIFFGKEGTGSSGSDSEAAYVLKTYRKSGDDWAQVVLFGNDGKTSDYELKSDLPEGLKKENVAVVKVQASGKLALNEYVDSNGKTVGSDSDFQAVTAAVYDKDGDKLLVKLKGETDSQWLKLASGAVIYDDNDVKSKSSIKYDKTNGEVVDIVIYDGTDIRAVNLSPRD